jgi:CubicO group peptidase (beta-lactamase class C family)
MDAYLSDLSGGRQFRGAVLVARGTDVLLSKGYDLADQAASIRNTPHTLFRIGSVTKQFTALAVLKLEELGKLNVTDRVCQHVTPCPAAWKTVTVEQLLVHTSGIPNYSGFPEYPSVLMTTLSPEQLVVRTRRQHRRVHLVQPDQAPRPAVDHRPEQPGDRRL